MGYQLEEAATLLDQELPDWSWSFTRIRNPGHIARPIGEGIGLDLLGPDGQLRVFEKHGSSALAAAERAIPRARARAAGDPGA